MEENRYVVEENFKNLSTKTKVIFEVKDHCFVNDPEIKIVPVILKYQFMWGLHGSDGKTIGASYSRFLEPKFKNSTTWKNINENRQRKIEEYVTKTYFSPQFSILLKFTQGRLTTLIPDNASKEDDFAPPWSRMPSKYIGVLSKEMKRVFNMDLQESETFYKAHQRVFLYV